MPVASLVLSTQNHTMKPLSHLKLFLSFIINITIFFHQFIKIYLILDICTLFHTHFEMKIFLIYYRSAHKLLFFLRYTSQRIDEKKKKKNDQKIYL